MTFIRIATFCFVAVLIFVPSATAQVNVTGTWAPSNWTLKIALTQEGDQVWGHGGAKDFWFRGRSGWGPADAGRDQLHRTAQGPLRCARRDHALG
jgi:hypothetical protein